VLLINHGKVTHQFEPQERVAQLLVIKLHQGDVYYQAADEKRKIKILQNMPQQRGDKDFGSSGK
jgi:dUTPase